MNPKQFMAEVETRLLSIFTAYAQGEDVPPAVVFRTEGFIDAGCYMALISQQDVVDLMQSLHQQVFGTELPVLSGDGIHIPSLMKRAPVYPS